MDVGLTQPLTNPFSGDPYGNYAFFAAAGTYHVQISGTGVLVTDIPYIVLGGGSGSGIQTFFGNTPGATLSVLTDPTKIIDVTGGYINFTTTGLTWADVTGDGCSGITGTLKCQDGLGDYLTLSDDVFKVQIASGLHPNFEFTGSAYYLNDGTATTISSAGGALTFADNVTLTGCGSGTYVKADGTGCATPSGGTVTSFSAPSGNWPTWLVPTVTNSTSTPSLAVAASAIPNSALANASLTVNGTTCTLGSSCTPSGGGGNPILENCTPDETGNSFYQVTSLTNYFNAAWQFVFNTTTYINCTVYIPTAQTGATVVVDVWSSDSTAGHTASITYADGVINTGTMNIGALTSASNQTFTTTSTANNRATLTFNVQSTLSNGSILVVKIGTAPTGTAPTANINVYPHFIL
jgi:hypothetical protein